MAVFFECSVCFNPFDDTVYVPKMLPCGHTVCLYCISEQQKQTSSTADSNLSQMDRLAREKEEEYYGSISKPNPKPSAPTISANVLYCPECRAQFQAESLPTNFGLLSASLSSMQKKASLSGPVLPNCAMCKRKSRPASFRCDKCKSYLCDVHANEHDEAHNLTPICDRPVVSSYSSSSSSEVTCIDHSRAIEFHCEDCDVIICSICAITSHKGHTCCCLTPAIISRLSTSMSTDIHRAGPLLPRIAEVLTIVNQELVQVNARSDSIHKDIDQAFDVLIRRVNDRREVIQRQADVFSANKRSALKSQLRELEQLSAGLSAACEFASKSLADRQDLRALSMKQVISSSVNRLESGQWPSHLKAVSNLDLIVSSDLAGSIHEFGVLSNGAPCLERTLIECEGATESWIDENESKRSTVSDNDDDGAVRSAAYLPKRRHRLLSKRVKINHPVRAQISILDNAGQSATPFSYDIKVLAEYPKSVDEPRTVTAAVSRNTGGMLSSIGASLSSLFTSSVALTPPVVVVNEAPIINVTIPDLTIAKHVIAFTPTQRGLHTIGLVIDNEKCDTSLTFHCSSSVSVISMAGQGSNGNPMTNSERYDVDEDKWTRIADIAAARTYFAACGCGGKAYVIGGWNGATLSTVECYDATADAWSRISEIPTPRRILGVAAINDDCFYCIGGWDGTTHFTTNERFDVVNKTWRTASPMPTGRGAFNICQVRSEAIWAVAGWNTDTLTNVERYDVREDRWVKLANTATGRFAFASSSSGDCVYIIGGWNGTANMNLVEQYDTREGIWTKKADLMDGARRYLSSVSVPHDDNDAIIVAGGYGVGDANSVFVDKYLPRDDRWIKLADIPRPRSSAALAAIHF